MDKARNKLTFELARKMIKERKYLSYDEEFKRYLARNLREHIEVCCDRGLLIEAYVLAIQYCSELIYHAFMIEEKEELKKNILPMIDILRNTGFLDREFCSDFKIVNDRRRDLVHKIVFNPKIVEKFSKTTVKSHAQVLNRIMDKSEKIFVGEMKKDPGKALPKYKKDRIRFSTLGLLTQIFLRQAYEEIFISFGDRDLDIKEFKEKWLPKIRENVHNKLKKTIGLKITRD